MLIFRRLGPLFCSLKRVPIHACMPSFNEQNKELILLSIITWFVLEKNVQAKKVYCSKVLVFTLLNCSMPNCFKKLTMDFSDQLAMSVNLQINQRGRVWHVKFQTNRTSKVMKLHLILKEKENKKNRPVDKKLEQNLWQEVVSCR